MKKIYTFIMLCAMALAGLSLAACNEGDDLSTNQFQSGVSLNAYGPQPVMRGGVLRFIGVNLDQVAEVQIPGCSPISDFEVKKAGVPSEIWVTVPKDGPEVGFVTLITNTGKEIVTKTQLTYEEPISIKQITARAMAGDVITIEGDYLNLIHMVAFAEDVFVSERNFVEHGRYAIKVKVPAEARTGKLSLYTLDLTIPENEESGLQYNIMQTDAELEVGLPVLTKVSSPRGDAAGGVVTAKAGESITLTGTRLDLIRTIKFGSVKVDEMTLNGTTTLSFILPAEAPEGEYSLICASGVEIDAGTLAVIAPSDCEVLPNPVKAGQPLNISGKNLDVVTAVEMPNVADAIEFAVEGETAIVVTAVPDAAQEGNLILRMANGHGVEVPFTLVKPSVTAYDKNPVNAGDVLTLTGINLDLVATISFGCDPAELKVADDANSATVSIPMEAVSGKPVLTLTNGSTQEIDEISIAEAVFCYVTAWPDDDHTPQAGTTVTLPVKNGEHLTHVYVNSIETKFVYVERNSEVVILIPESARAKSTFKLVSDNGEVEYKKIAVKPNSEVVTVLWQGPAELGWDGAGQVYIGSDGGAELVAAEPKAGDIIRIAFQPTADKWEVQIHEGHWGGQIDDIKPENYDLAGNDNCYYITLTDELIAKFTTPIGWGGMLVVQGEGMIVTEMALIQKIQLETTLWEGEAIADDWGGQPGFLTDGGAELAAVEAKAGQILRFYITPLSDVWKVQIMEGHWGPTYASLCAVGADTEDGKFTEYDLADNDGVISIVLTQEMLDAAYTVGYWGNVFLLNGDDVKCTKLTIE